MSNKVVVIFAVIFVALFTVACGGEGEPGSYADPSQAIQVKSGDEFVIALESNPTTGYSWEESSDSAMVELLKTDYKPDDADEGVTGSGGTDHFTYKALQAGETKIELTYGQHWDGGDVEEPLVFTVVID